VATNPGATQLIVSGAIVDARFSVSRATAAFEAA
jgi:hypothetical protein